MTLFLAHHRFFAATCIKKYLAMTAFSQTFIKNMWWPFFAHRLFFSGRRVPSLKKVRSRPPRLRPNTPCLPCNTYTWWPFFVFWLIADFSRGNASPLLSQKSEWSSSLHIPAPIHPACHAIPILDDPFCCFCSSPIFPGRTRSLSQKKWGVVVPPRPRPNTPLPALQ